jgi:hypothetical protein
MAKKFDAKAKAKRTKIIAGVLGVVLIGVLAWQIPSLMSTMNKKPPPNAAPAPPPAATGAPAPVTPPPGAAPAPTGTPVAVGTLVDSDPSPQAGSGQLLSFDRFESKDPFVQQTGAPQAGAPPAAKAAPSPQTPPPPPPPPPPVSSAARLTSAQISVNGETEQVGVGAKFPASDPVFRLVSLKKTTAKVAIAGGSLSTGDGAVTLTKGKKLTLMNTADGTRYELVLKSVS